MSLAVEVRHFRHGDPGQQPVHGLDHDRLRAQLQGDRSGFQTDIATANDGDLLARCEIGFQRVDIGDRAQIAHAVQIGAGNGQGAHARAGGDHQLRIAFFAAILKADGFAGAINGAGATGQAQFDRLLGPGFRRLQPQTALVDLAGQIGLGQRRTLIGRVWLVAGEEDTALKAIAPQRGGALPSGLARTQNDHRLFGIAHAFSPKSHGRVAT